MIGTLFCLGVLAVVALAARRAMRSLQARVAQLESRTDAAQRWQDEVRQALAAATKR